MAGAWVHAQRHTHRQNPFRSSVTADSGNPEKSVTFDRNDRSRSAEISGHLRPEYAPQGLILGGTAAGPGGAGMRTHDGAVDQHLLEVRIGRYMGLQVRPYPALTSPGEALENTVPGAETARQEAPLRAAAEHPEDRLEKTTTGRLRAHIDPRAGHQKRQDQAPLLIPKHRSIHHTLQIAAENPPRTAKCQQI